VTGLVDFESVRLADPLFDLVWWAWAVELHYPSLPQRRRTIVTKNNRSTSPETSFTSISIPQLRAALNGRVIAPDDAGYDEARTVFYGAPPAIGVGPSVTSLRSVPSEE
jgi:hypothetical protein